MGAAKHFNGLDGKSVTREYLVCIVELAKAENNTDIIYRLSKILNDNPKDKEFSINVEKHKTTGLNAPRHSGLYKDALDSCGRLRPGFRFENGSVIGVKPKRKKVAVIKQDAPVKKTVVKAEPKKATKPVKKAVVKTTEPKASATVAKKDLDKLNPKSYANKPKSASVATAVKDVLSTGKYKDINAKQAQVLYYYFSYITKEELDIHGSSQDVKLYSKYEIGILKSESPYHTFNDWDNSISLFNAGVALMQSIKGRLDSLTNQKHSNAMFDGLKGAVEPTIVPEDTEREYVPEEPTNIVEESEPQQTAGDVLPGSVAAKRQQRQNQVREYYHFDNPEIAKLLGNVERKQKESVAITIAGGQGSMKTRFLFQVIEALGKHYNCGHASMEEHPDSGLYDSKADQYLSTTTQGRLKAPEITTTQAFEDLVRESEVIFIDSWKKLTDLYGGRINLDTHLRKHYDGKLFIIIYQLTTDGKMRGGSESQFDADIVLFTEKCANYKDNYIKTDKNRYNALPADELNFNIFRGEMVSNELEQEVNEPEPVATVSTNKPKLLFKVV